MSWGEISLDGQDVAWSKCIYSNTYIYQHTGTLQSKMWIAAPKNFELTDRDNNAMFGCF